MRYSLLILLLTSSEILSAQSVDTASSSRIDMQPVVVKQYFSKQSILELTSSAHTLTAQSINAQQPTSLTSAINTVAGMRMEERSPGSYRLSMRGSLIRSPFGIRNTKVYIDELPLTDAGGNTYLNLLSPQSIANIQIIKGPDGSLFGANSGGVIRIDPVGFTDAIDQVDIQLTGGAFGMFQQNLDINKSFNNNYQFAINQSYLTSEGYRENSAFSRKTIQTSHKIVYNRKATFKLFALYSDLDYQTPGGLTLAQYEENPKSARPAAGPNPSAIDQKAAIYNKTFYGGFGNDLQISSRWSHYIGIFGSYTDFENPFITNYEFRNEKNIGLRTFFSFHQIKSPMPFQFQIGLETQNGWNKIDNFDNNKGTVGNPQAKDLLDNNQLNLFSRIHLNLSKNWLLESSLGLNKNSIHFETKYPEDAANKGDIDFKDVWMPRVATSYQIGNQMALRASISKGYSTPTLAEIRSSDNIINHSLLAESGTNYEVGYKIQSKNKNWLFDVSLYQYIMNNGIVRNLNDQGVEYYQNAGEMNQKGVEASYWSFWEFNTILIKSLQFNTALALNHYRFGHYKNVNSDYTNNKITSVPDRTLANTLILNLVKQFSLNIFHNYTSSIPLDDANTVFADKYNLIQAKLNWSNVFRNHNIKYTIFLGVDNLLDEKYSLGNDINAFGGRYFNTSPSRNIYGGIKFSFKNK